MNVRIKKMPDTYYPEGYVWSVECRSWKTLFIWKRYVTLLGNSYTEALNYARVLANPVVIEVKNEQK